VGDVGSCRNQHSDGPAETETTDGPTLQRVPFVNLQATSSRDEGPIEAETDRYPSLDWSRYIKLPDSSPYSSPTVKQYTFIARFEHARASLEYHWILEPRWATAEINGASIAAHSYRLG